MTFIVKPADKKDNAFWMQHYGGAWGYLINVFSAPNSMQSDNRLVAFVGPDNRIHTLGQYSVKVEVQG